MICQFGEGFGIEFVWIWKQIWLLIYLDSEFEVDFEIDMEYRNVFASIVPWALQSSIQYCRPSCPSTSSLIW